MWILELVKRLELENQSPPDHKICSFFPLDDSSGVFSLEFHGVIFGPFLDAL